MTNEQSKDLISSESNTMNIICHETWTHVCYYCFKRFEASRVPIAHTDVRSLTMKIVLNVKEI